MGRFVRLAGLLPLSVALSCLSASPSSATADADPVVLVHQEGDGTLWYNRYDAPPNKHILSAAHPCWVDHDHVRLGTRVREDCAASRP